MSQTAKDMKHRPAFDPWRLWVAGMALLALGGCNTLRTVTAPQPSFYSLDNARAAAPATAPATAGLTPAGPTLIINPPHAAAGFDSQRIIYVREAHKIEYFAHSEWVDPPARMLAPLLVGALEATGAFRAVVLTPSAAAGDVRLDTEVVRLQHEFATAPSRVRFTLRATLVDEKARRVLASREFDVAVPAASDDPHGGVVAANRAGQTALENLAAFCAEAVRGRPMEK